MESLLTGKIINLGIQIKGLIMIISQDIRLPFFIIVFLLTLLCTLLNSEPLSSWKPALPCMRGSFTVFPIHRLLFQWQMLLGTRQLDGKKWITIQMYTFRMKRLWHGWLWLYVLRVMLWESMALQYGWNCKIPSAQKNQTPKYRSLKWENLLQISCIAWQLKVG